MPEFKIKCIERTDLECTIEVKTGTTVAETIEQARNDKDAAWKPAGAESDGLSNFRIYNADGKVLLWDEEDEEARLWNQRMVEWYRSRLSRSVETAGLLLRDITAVQNCTDLEQIIRELDSASEWLNKLQAIVSDNLAKIGSAYAGRLHDLRRKP